MGWDIAAIGFKHKVDTSSTESIAKFLMEHFNANIQCRIMELGWNEDGTFPTLSEFKSFVCEGSTHNIEIEEDRTGYMGSRDSWLLSFDWNPFPCYNDNDNPEIIMYEDMISMELVERPFRWFGFLNNFVEHEPDEMSDKYCREALDKFRKSIREYANVFCCEKVMYIADQGPGEFILYQCEKIDADSMTGYTYGALDVPKFLSEGQDLIRQGKEEGYLDVLIDDFRDIP